MALSSGTKLGPYEIVAPLGAGGMGEVYRARDTRLDRTVAIKILPAHLSDNPEAKQRFDREARAISSLNHPNICTLYDVGHQDGIDYLVMEFLEGETLADRLVRGPLPPDQVLKYGVEICEGLEKAHRGGVTHRDLKPGNIMLTKTGAKLMDFGLAKACSSSGGASASDLTLTSPVASRPLTQEGMVVGTFQYMSPEQIEGKEADARSDIFAMGAVLYEMATGKRAFTGKTQASIVAAILAAEPQLISTVQPMSPPALDRVVAACVAKDPDERFQTVHDLKLQVKWVAESGSKAGVTAPVAGQRKNREQMLWGALALLFAGCVALAVIHFGRTVTERQVIHAYIPPPEKSTFAFVGDHTGPVVISPDGTRLVFAALGPEGKQMLWLRPLGAASSQPLAGTVDAAYPFWSPDSRFIGFFAGGKLKTVGVAGGGAQVLCDALDGRGGTWNRDGTIVFTPNFLGPLYRVSIAGGAPPVQVTELDPSQQENSHRWPQFLPDGQHFLFFARSRQRAVAGAYVGSLDSKERKLLFRSPTNVVYAAPGYLLFVRENTLMAQAFDYKQMSLSRDVVPIAQSVLVNYPYGRAIFSASDNGVLAYGGAPSAAEPTRLRWLDRTGKQIDVVGDPGMYANPRLSPDGTKLAVAVADASRAATDIWIYDLRHGGKTRLTFDSSLNVLPIWSGDGSQIAFDSNRKGFPQLYRKAANGEGGDELLLASNTTDLPDDWSPDGRFLLYEPSPGQTELWLLPLSGERKPVVFLSGEEGGTQPGEGTFSRDGKWLAFTEYSGGNREVYITSFPGKTGKWQVSVAGGHYPRWRGDGKELFFLRADNATVMAVDLDLKNSVPRIGTPKELFPVHLALLPYMNRLGSAWDPFEVAADGKRFLVNSPDQMQVAEPINVVVNWDAELKK